jgi:hypothetical protein
MPTAEKCAHPACDCPAQEGEKYCSPYCHDAGDLTEISAAVAIWIARRSCCPAMPH